MKYVNKGYLNTMNICYAPDCDILVSEILKPMLQGYGAWSTDRVLL